MKQKLNTTPKTGWQNLFSKQEFPPIGQLPIVYRGRCLLFPLHAAGCSKHKHAADRIVR